MENFFCAFFLIKAIKHVEIKEDQAFQLICMFKLEIKKIIIIYINVVACIMNLTIALIMLEM